MHDQLDKRKHIIRTIIEGVTPEVDNGRFPIKRITGDEVMVEADIYADSHDVLSAVLLYRQENASKWTETSMELMVNDRWRGSFKVTELGQYCYTIMAWVDRFKSWQQKLIKKAEANKDVTIEFQIASQIVAEAVKRASGRDVQTMEKWLETLNSTKVSNKSKVKLVAGKAVTRLMDKYADRQLARTYHNELQVTVDRERARFGAWYEMFPRSCASGGRRYGTFKDCEDRLPYIASMGFDVLYLPPIHPIGHTYRKGRNNNPVSEPGDPGTPWAIGSKDGGHKAVHPELGSLEDFRHLIIEAQKYDIEVALDLAFQCSPDHPYVEEHPEWFRWRPDSSIQYAENPPKEYQDIYPLDFESEHWPELWEELKSVVFFWIEQGIRIFRVDNPHTKPFAFWEWLISELKKAYPDVIFLSEAFTRPKIMYRLAKLGFSQSYTYFAWRNTKWELTQYFTELTKTDIRQYFRPSLWTNTPDILTEYLQFGGRPAFITRLVLAATLGASYGIYGPAFELCQNTPREPGSEEYLDSEKYQIKQWDISKTDSLKDFIARINRIRKGNSALQSNRSLHFHNLDNEQLICYSKQTEDFSNVIIVVVNLDYHYTQSGWVQLDLQALGLQPQEVFQVHDLLSDARYQWHGSRNYIELKPDVCPAHIFLVRRGNVNGNEKNSE
ncbi:alpha-1,4-glucan--maltose-1-phosphate maltosyltransferase [Chloroflexota bacterium]